MESLYASLEKQRHRDCGICTAFIISITRLLEGPQRAPVRLGQDTDQKPTGQQTDFPRAGSERGADHKFTGSNKALKTTLCCLRREGRFFPRGLETIRFFL